MGKLSRTPEFEQMQDPDFDVASVQTGGATSVPPPPPQASTTGRQGGCTIYFCMHVLHTAA